MIFLYLILFVLFFIDCVPRFLLGNKFNREYLSKEICNAIKGFFVVLVFLSHGSGYISSSTILGGYGIMTDKLFFIIANLLGQLIVVMFLFYSGYGIYEQLKIKGENYKKNFLQKRFLPTYINFVVCVFFYYLLSIVLHSDYEVRRIILSFIGWESIGNSNWFMFVTFVLYLIFFVSFRFARNNRTGLIIFTALSVVFTALLYVLKESWWWNTLLCFTLGMWWSYFRELIESKLLASSKKWILAFVFVFISFAAFYVFGRKIPLAFIGTSLFFALTICIAMMKINIQSGRIFAFLGSHVFSIYILQRLVFMMFEKLGLNSVWYLYMSLCFVVTILFATGYDKVFALVRRK